MPIALSSMPSNCGESWRVALFIDGGGYNGTATRSTPHDSWIVTGLSPVSLLGLPLAPALPDGYVVHVASADMHTALGAPV